MTMTSVAAGTEVEHDDPFQTEVATADLPTH